MGPDTVYAAEWCDCIHESGFYALSLHTSKAGAYRAMRTKIEAAWNEWNNVMAEQTYHDTSPKDFRLNSNRRRRKDHRVALGGKAWRIQVHTLQA